MFMMTLTLVLAACQTPQKNPVASSGVWQLTDVAGQAVLEPSQEFADRPAPFIRLEQSGNGPIKVSGYGGCNDFTRTIDFSDPATDLNVIATQKHCGEDVSVQELHIFRVLSGNPDFAFDHDTQTIYVTGEDGRRLVGKSIGEVRSTPEGNWTVVAVNGEPADRGPDDPPITVDIDGKAISAVSQCIEFKWTYQLDNAAMKTAIAPRLDANGDPKPMCATGLSILEKKFSDVIGNAISYGFDSGEHLVVSSPRGSLTLKRS